MGETGGFKWKASSSSLLSSSDKRVERASECNGAMFGEEGFSGHCILGTSSSKHEKMGGPSASESIGGFKEETGEFPCDEDECL
jgi:hypothetical protein